MRTFCEQKHSPNLAPGALGIQGAHIVVDHPRLCARIGGSEQGISWAGVCATTRCGQTAEGKAATPNQLRTVGFQLRYCGFDLGAIIEAQASSWRFTDESPRLRQCSQPGRMSCCNSALHLPPSTTFLPLTRLMGFCF